MVHGDGLDGHRVVAEGREAVIYEWGDGLVLRLMRSADAGAAVDASTIASEAAREAGVPTPRVVEVIEVDGVPGQVLERVDGRDLFADVAANPLRLPRAASTLARVQAELHQVRSPIRLASTNDRLRTRIEASDEVPEDIRGRALATLARLPEGDVICHGDCHPGNVLLTVSGPVLIDWTGATRGDPTADFARTRLMLRVGALPPGASPVIRALATVARGALGGLYERAYRRARPVDPLAFEQWTLVAAASRLAEGIEAERADLLDLLRPVSP